MARSVDRLCFILPDPARFNRGKPRFLLALALELLALCIELGLFFRCQRSRVTAGGIASLTPSPRSVVDQHPPGGQPVNHQPTAIDITRLFRIRASLDAQARRHLPWARIKPIRPNFIEDASVYQRTSPVDSA